MRDIAHLNVEIEVSEVWMTPREDMSLEEAVGKLAALGHTILDVDTEGRRIRVR